jgi:AcrR family transcriptional regulator
MVGMPNRNRQAERREATRQEILTAAWDVARQNGIAGVTLREVAVRVGMQPPSLYSHFASKNAIYDAMFEQAWQDCMDSVGRAMEGAPGTPRARLLALAQAFFDYAMTDVERSQLMNVRVVPDFTPSAEAYRPAVECFEAGRKHLAELGISRSEDFDLYTALLAGLLSQQQANDPHGTRWRDLLPKAITMFADAAGLPADAGKPGARKSGRKS